MTTTPLHAIPTVYAPSSPASGPLAGDLHADAVIVGGGIVGVTAAVQLAERGADVVLVTADEVGDGVTGRSTAKVTALHQLVYDDLAQRHGPSAAATYAAACSAAISWLRDVAGPVWEERDAVTVARTADEATMIREEARAAEAAGLPVTVASTVADWPGEATAGLRLTGQGQVDPVALLQHMLDSVSGQVRVLSRSRAIGLRERPGTATVRTEGGTATAPHVVIATHMNVFDRSGFFALAEPKSSYIVALEHPDGPEGGDMMITAGEPSRSVRWATDARTGARVVLVGGEGHHVGSGGPTTPRYERLEAWAREHIPGAGAVVARWSAMDYMAADRLPLAGPHLRVGGPVQAVTGLSKWGFTLGVACATAVVERIDTGTTTDFGRLVDPARLPDRKGAAKVVGTNAKVAAHMATGWASGLLSPPPHEPAEGEGAVGRGEPVPRGRCRVGGTVHDVSAVCPHLGGIVSWNDGDQTWDCPLHGSRYHADGAVRHGPATRGLSS